MQKKRFTLIELLVVVSIISILAGLVLNGLGPSVDKAKRLESSNNVKQLALNMLNQGHVKSSSISKDFLTEVGVRTLKANESGDVAFGSYVIQQTTSPFQKMVVYNGVHPFDPNGHYICMGNAMGNTVSKFDSDARIVLEMYNWDDKGDGKVSVGFADGRVEVLDVTTPFGLIDIDAVMATRGTNGGQL